MQNPLVALALGGGSGGGRRGGDAWSPGHPLPEIGIGPQHVLQGLLVGGGEVRAGAIRQSGSETALTGPRARATTSAWVRSG